MGRLLRRLDRAVVRWLRLGRLEGPDLGPPIEPRMVVPPGHHDPRILRRILRESALDLAGPREPESGGFGRGWRPWRP